MKPYDAIVIGAGLNGLTAAALLARAGRNTLLLEQRAEVGGLAGHHAIHAGAPAPCILQDTGGLSTGLLSGLRLQDHGLVLRQERPPLHVLLDGGGRISLSADTGATHKSISCYSPRDADGYSRYRAFCGRVAPAFEKLLLRPVPQRQRDILPLLPHVLKWWRSPAIHELMRLAPMSAKDFLDEFFELDGLKAALAMPAFQASYGGPFAPFGALHILMREAMSRHFVVGGLAALVATLRQAATHYGVTIKMHARVVEIALSSTGAACGVRIDSGETIGGKLIAAACSPKEVFESLLHHRALGQEFAWQMRNLRSRGTTAHLALAMGSATPSLAPYARVAPGIEALEHAFDHVKTGSLPDSFALEVAVQTDPAVLSVLVHFVPFRVKGGWTRSAREELIRRVVAQLSPHFPGPVLTSRLLTPEDLKTEFHLPGGHLYHLEQAPDQLFVRPMVGHAAQVTGLFLCGSGTHPGGSIACAPGALAARAMLSS